jgi:hypothetical protein
MPNRRLPLVSDPGPSSGTPQADTSDESAAPGKDVVAIVAYRSGATPLRFTIPGARSSFSRWKTAES